MNIVHWFILTGSGTVLLAQHPVMAKAQDAPRATPIPTRAECPDCRIIVRTHLVLGDTIGDGELPSSAYFVRRDERDRYFISFARPILPKVYDASGRYLGAIGGIGDGPGEFRMPLLFHASHDSVLIADPANARISAFRLNFPRSELLESWRHQAVSTPPMAAIYLADGAMLINATIATEERIGYPLHLLTPSGGVRSFGSEAPEFRPGLPRLNFRAITEAKAGGMWVVHNTKYEIERYTAQGELIRRWSRSVPWFPPNRGEEKASAVRPPQPRTAAIAEDEHGLVWVLTLVPDPRHREAFGPDPHVAPGGRVQTLNLEDQNLYFDTVIEVFDPSRGTILASTRVDEALVTLLGFRNGSLLTASEGMTDRGGFQIVVRQLTAAGLERFARRH